MGGRRKERNINSIQGLLRPCFRQKQGADPAYASWLTQLENLLTQSYTEQNLYDFKQGFCTLAQPARFDQGSLSKVALTLAAMSNLEPKAKGYVIVGIADKQEDAERIETLYNVEPRSYGSFLVTGVEHEAGTLGKSLDQYFSMIVEKIRHEPLSNNLKQHILSNIRLVRYLDKALIILECQGQSEPSAYAEEYFVRQGAKNVKLRGEELAPLFHRFSSISG